MFPPPNFPSSNAPEPLVEVRSDVEGALLGWLPLPRPLRVPVAHIRAVRYILNPWARVRRHGDVLEAASPSGYAQLELPVRTWASTNGVLPSTRSVLECRLEDYDALRAIDV